MGGKDVFNMAEDTGISCERNDAADLPAAARRALAEAAERRARAASVAPASAEKGGPGGPEPTRYGDWERNGRAVDFS